ncbi:MAG: glycosyl hydrolase 2 galactose-binding domain-containing protein [Gaiellaceae bacterium]
MIPLDGDGWQLRGCLGDEWEWHVGPEKPWDAPGWLPARVPGSVVDDLVRGGEAPSPYHERDSRLVEWAAGRHWIYRRQIDVAPGASTLRFGGVDYSCTVLVDGRAVARHEGLFRPFDVDLADVADGERHLLAVVVHPAPASEPQVGRTSRVRVHKPRMNYGWDFCPRLVHQGIWRSVSLCDGSPDAQPLVRLEDSIGTVEVDGEVVLRIEDPQLWWPNGLGEQHLYPVELGGRDVHVGFRTVELEPPEPGALPYAFVVNGVRMYVKGWNWCPLDALYGVPRREKLERLLRLARRAHVNVLRVWGGGLIETTEFYEACDRLGLLVWQDFAQSSSGLESVPARDADFGALMADEARWIVAEKRRHPSLAVWCGGNELAAHAEGRDDVPLDDAHPVLGALRDVVRELDRGRAWLPTTPSGPRFLNRLDLIREDPHGQHDVHGPWEHQGLRAQYELYDAGTAILHSEFGVEGMTNRRALEALIDEPHRWPADRSNPVYEHLGAWWNNVPLVQECFGGRIRDLDTLRRASQWLQYDGLRYAVEANMRRARSVGVLPWQFNESFPNAWCTAAVDWHGEPKPAYWGVARAYRDGNPTAQFATCAWGGETHVRAVLHGGATGRLVNVDGTVVAEAREEIAAPVAELSDVFVLDLDGRNRYVMTTAETLAPLLDLPRTTLTLEDGRVRNSGDVVAVGVLLDGEVDDNVIDLLPGETRTVGAATAAEGWNAAA